MISVAAKRVCVVQSTSQNDNREEIPSKTRLNVSLGASDFNGPGPWSVYNNDAHTYLNLPAEYMASIEVEADRKANMLPIVPKILHAANK